MQVPSDPLFPPEITPEQWHDVGKHSGDGSTAVPPPAPTRMVAVQAAAAAVTEVSVTHEYVDIVTAVSPHPLLLPASCHSAQLLPRLSQTATCLSQPLADMEATAAVTCTASTASHTVDLRPPQPLRTAWSGTSNNGSIGDAGMPDAAVTAMDDGLSTCSTPVIAGGTRLTQRDPSLVTACVTLTHAAAVTASSPPPAPPAVTQSSADNPSLPPSATAGPHAAVAVTAATKTGYVLSQSAGSCSSSASSSPSVQGSGPLTPDHATAPRPSLYATPSCNSCNSLATTGNMSVASSTAMFSHSRSASAGSCDIPVALPVQATPHGYGTAAVTAGGYVATKGNPTITGTAPAGGDHAPAVTSPCLPWATLMKGSSGAAAAVQAGQQQQYSSQPKSAHQADGQHMAGCFPCQWLSPSHAAGTCKGAAMADSSLPFAGRVGTRVVAAAAAPAPPPDPVLLLPGMETGVVGVVSQQPHGAITAASQRALKAPPHHPLLVTPSVASAYESNDLNSVLDPTLNDTGQVAGNGSAGSTPVASQSAAAGGGGGRGGGWRLPFSGGPAGWWRRVWGRGGSEANGRGGGGRKGDEESGLLLPRAPALVRSRIEPKTFFAAERTFLSWLNLSALLLLVSLSLMATALSLGAAAARNVQNAAAWGPNNGVGGWSPQATAALPEISGGPRSIVASADAGLEAQRRAAQQAAAATAAAPGTPGVTAAVPTQGMGFVPGTGLAAGGAAGMGWVQGVPHVGGGLMGGCSALGGASAGLCKAGLVSPDQAQSRCQLACMCACMLGQLACMRDVLGVRLALGGLYLGSPSSCAVLSCECPLRMP